MSSQYLSPGPSREETDSFKGNAVLQFGNEFCGFCQNAEPFIIEALKSVKNLNHIKVEDGPGRKLGRSYRVKLWPTLIILKNGMEVGRVVRPNSVADIQRELSKLL